MVDALLILAVLGVGFWLLAKGGTWLVDGGAGLARRFGWGPLAIGLTVVAWGTSVPELIASGLASAQGNPGITFGNVLGSNVANIGLVLGVSAMILPSVLGQRLALRECFWLLASMGALWWVCADGEVAREESIQLLVVFAVYNVHLWWTQRGKVEAFDTEIGSARPWRHAILGSIAIAIGAKLVVDGAVMGAREIGVSDRVIGLTVVAIGTSLPELAAGIAGALRGERHISLGNVVGSNVFNVLAVIGLIGIFLPYEAEDERVGQAIQGALALDFRVVLAFSVAAVLLPWLGGSRGGRVKGLALLLGYAAYNVYLF